MYFFSVFSRTHAVRPYKKFICLCVVIRVFYVNLLYVFSGRIRNAPMVEFNGLCKIIENDRKRTDIRVVV